MQYQQYIEEIRDCPNPIDFVEWDSEFGPQRHTVLAADFGIYDNFPILMRATFDDFLSALPDMDFTAYHTSGEHAFANYNPGCVKLQFQSKHLLWCMTQPEQNEEHHVRQRELCTLALMLHPYQSDNAKGEIGKIGDQHHHESMVQALESICDYAVEHDIPFCISQSMGFRDMENYERIVYFP